MSDEDSESVDEPCEHCGETENVSSAKWVEIFVPIVAMKLGFKLTLGA